MRDKGKRGAVRTPGLWEAMNTNHHLPVFRPPSPFLLLLLQNPNFVQGWQCPQLKASIQTPPTLYARHSGSSICELCAATFGA